MKTYLKIFLALFLFLFSAHAVPTKWKIVEKTEKKELLKKPKKEDLKRLFPFSLNDVADKIVTVSIKDKTERGEGSGFLAKVNGKTYLFTNQHLIMGKERVQFQIVGTGKIIHPLQIELSMTHDMARLLIEDQELEGLEIDSSMIIGSPIVVFGNSSGAGVATELYGKIKTVSADLVEVSADFVSGNSGSPVLTTNQTVVGIATFLRITLKNGKEEIRRFCYRLTGNAWKKVDWKQYQQKYGRPYLRDKQVAETILEATSLWLQDPYASINLSHSPSFDLRQWSTSHHEMVELITSLKEEKDITAEKRDKANLKIRRYMIENVNLLLELCRKQSMRFINKSQDPNLTGFLEEEYLSLAYQLLNTWATVREKALSSLKIDCLYFKSSSSE